MKKFYDYLRKSSSLLLLALGILFHSSAHAQCAAYFQSSYNSSTDEVEFTPVCTYDTSIHPIIYQWDFGDGYGAYGDHPSHHYPGQNNYLVCLILYVGNGAGCCQDTFCEMIDFVPASVQEKPEWISDVSIHATDKTVSLYLALRESQVLRMSLVTITGREIPVHVSKTIFRGRNEIDFAMPDYPPGIYLMRIEDETGHSISRRFMLY
jgi:hypothetical protein